MNSSTPFVVKIGNSGKNLTRCSAHFKFSTPSLDLGLEIEKNALSLKT
jgi:hypothetical protein